MKHIYQPGSGLDQTESFFDSVQDAAQAGGAVLDSAATADVIASTLTSEGMPTRLRALLDQVDGGENDSVHARVVRSVLDGINNFERTHGVRPSADVIDAAISQGMIVAGNGKELNLPGGATLDGVGNTSHHDPISAQPNRIVVAITSALAEAIPFAAYLPADIGSNESLLGIVSHQAHSTFGDYKAGDLLDGINTGNTYVASERTAPLTLGADRTTATGGIFTTTGGATTQKLLRGRSIVYVNGYPCATENHKVNASVPNSPISGSINLGGTNYTIGGSVTSGTGAFNLTFAPALPVGSVVTAEGYIDFELQPELTPEILTEVQTWSLFASAWRVIMQQTPDSQTQYNNEIGLDLLSESLMAGRNQISMERHYLALRKLKAIAVNQNAEYDFDYSLQMAQKTRSQIWQDFSSIIGVVDQEMAENTMDHGITHLYVTKNVKAQFESLPAELWQGSGLTARPGIYRLGRLFNRYEVYYTPKVLVEGQKTSEILAIGRSPQVARCPIVMGDAVPPTIIPLSVGKDLQRGNAIYGRNFTQVNPHQPSAMGVAIISITNLFA